MTRKIVLILLSGVIFIFGCSDTPDYDINEEGYGCFTESQCKEWAQDNKIPIKACVGYWICEDMQCDFKCGRKDELIKND